MRRAGVREFAPFWRSLRQADLGAERQAHAATQAGTVLAQDTPNDAQIAAIVVTANQVDIDAGKLAKTKASAKDVKAFA